MADINCIKCGKLTPSSNTYCNHCGTKLDFTFDQIRSTVGEEIFSEKAEETEAFFGWILSIVFFLFISGLIFKSMWSQPPVPKIMPGYFPKFNEKFEWKDISKPVVLFEKD